VDNGDLEILVARDEPANGELPEVSEHSLPLGDHEWCAGC
jgi:hypothetical protein